MRAPSLAAIVLVLIAGSLFVLVAIGGGSRDTPKPVTAGAPLARSVSANGFALTSTGVELPDDAALFPDGPNAALVNQRCLACHSASMVLTQPKLKPEQWRAIVEKMRDTYRAPVTEGEVAPIVTYLAGRQGG